MSGMLPDGVDSLSNFRLLGIGVGLALVLVGGILFVQPGLFDPGSEGTAGDVEPIYEPPLSSQNVSSGHLSAIESAGTVTYTRHKEIVSAGIPFQNTTTTERYDLAADSKYVVKAVGEAELAGYSTPESSYIRLKQADGNVSYGTGQEYGKVNSPLALAFDTHRPDNLGLAVIDAANLSFSGQKTEDGTTVFVYEATGSSQFERERVPGGLDELTTAKLRLEITASGTIKQYEYRFEDTTGDLDRRVFRLTVSDAGATTVSEPSWLSEAKANTSP